MSLLLTGRRDPTDRYEAVRIKPFRSTRLERPEHLPRPVVVESVTGHVVHVSGRTTVTVQDHRGRRYHGMADTALMLNAPVIFDISEDREAGSRLRVATNIVALAQE